MAIDWTPIIIAAIGAFVAIFAGAGGGHLYYKKQIKKNTKLNVKQEVRLDELEAKVDDVVKISKSSEKASKCAQKKITILIKYMMITEKDEKKKDILRVALPKGWLENDVYNARGEEHGSNNN